MFGYSFTKHVMTKFKKKILDFNWSGFFFLSIIIYVFVFYMNIFGKIGSGCGTLKAIVRIFLIHTKIFNSYFSGSDNLMLWMIAGAPLNSTSTVIPDLFLKGERPMYFP